MQISMAQALQVSAPLGTCEVDQINKTSDQSTKQRPAFRKTNLPTYMSGHCLFDTVNQDAKLMNATEKVSVFQNHTQSV